MPDAGRFDGPLGVLAAIAVVERLAARGGAAVPLEVVAFADEEGPARVPYLGSAAYAGVFERDWLELVDAKGSRSRDAIRAIGGDPDGPSACRARALAGYLEVHIEQGPVLEDEGLPVGVVTAIAGQSRASLTLSGEAGHAGTVPMGKRRDALVAAAELVVAVERIGRSRRARRDGRGAVGLVRGGERRAADAACRSTCATPGRRPARAVEEVRRGDRAPRRRRRHRVGVDDGARRAGRRDGRRPPRAARRRRGGGPPGPARLVSGAGHDAVVLSRVCPAAMLFVRVAGGVSHDPRESVTEDDVAVAIDVLERVVLGRVATDATVDSRDAERAERERITVS